MDEDEDYALDEELSLMTVELYLLQDEDGDWAISTVQDEEGAMIPLVGFSETSKRVARRLAFRVASATGCVFRVVEFVPVRELAPVAGLPRDIARVHIIALPETYRD